MSIGRMLLCSFVAALVATFLASPTIAQYFPPAPENLTVVTSQFNKDITISFKEVSSHTTIYPISKFLHPTLVTQCIFLSSQNLYHQSSR